MIEFLIEKLHDTRLMMMLFAAVAGGLGWYGLKRLREDL